MRHSLITAVLILTVFTINAVGAKITGRVVDTDNIPIEGANIQTDIGNLRTDTDSDGKFTLIYKNEIPAYFTISHISYQPRMIDIAKYKKDMVIMMSPAVYPGQNIRVTAMRAQAGVTPVAFSDISADEVARDYTVEDFPKLLETTPNMYAYTYTGANTGASDFKIRGFDYKRIGVYINGIPLNDPEDRFTYFYDLADFAADASDIQVQRGVGNSLYGDASFGGAINIASAGAEQGRKITALAGYGAYYSNGKHISDIRKQAFEYSSGLINGRWSLSGRYSKLYSGGYREQSWYDGTAYFFSASRIDPNMSTTINIYGGPMKAHLAFNGVSRADMAEYGRRYNPDSYSNEIDDFSQPHYELHNAYRINDKMTLNNTLYYIRGKGYYEQMKTGKDIGEYNILPAYLVDSTQAEIDLIRQKWVAKNQWGWNPRLEWEHHGGTAVFGGAFYYFDSDHWGQVISATNVNESLDLPYKYYQYYGEKVSASVYGLEYLSLADNIRLMGNLQLRYLRYNFDQKLRGNQPLYNYTIDWLFLSPRTGLIYKLNDETDLHFSFGIASREPSDNTIFDAEDMTTFPQLEVKSISVTGTDTIYTFGDPLAKAERVYNFELGGNYRSENYKLGVNLFWMEFKNEIVNNGQIDDDGRPVLGNIERSVHSGVELDGSIYVNKYLSLAGNFSYNHNRIKSHIEYNDTDYDGFVDDTVNYSGNTVGGFPDYIGNLTADMNYKQFRLIYRWRAIGKQYVENDMREDFAIDDYMVSSVSLAVELGDPFGIGRLSVSGNIDNLWNKKYEQSGYAYIWYGDEWTSEYYVGPERNFFVQLKLDLD